MLGIFTLKVPQKLPFKHFALYESWHGAGESRRRGSRGVQEVGSPWQGRGPLPRKMVPAAMLGSMGREAKRVCMICGPSCDPLPPTHPPQALCLQPEGWRPRRPALAFRPVLLSVEPFFPSSHQNSFLSTNNYNLLSCAEHHRLRANILERK